MRFESMGRVVRCANEADRLGVAAFAIGLPGRLRPQSRSRADGPSVGAGCAVE